MTMRRSKALLIFVLIMGLTTAFPGSPKEPTPATSWTSSMMKAVSRAARVLRIGGSSSNNNNNNNAANGNNYSVSFVPLFSLIANFLPKLLARFATPPGSRSLDRKVPAVDMTKGIFCSPQHIGRWRDVSNCHQFYTCEMNPDAPPGCHNFLMGRETPFKATDDIQVNNNISSSISGKQMDSYKNSCVTVKTFSCPSKFVFSDETKECVPETQMKIC